MGRKVIFLNLLLTVGAIRVSVAQQPVRPTIDLPLHTRGSLIVDSRNYPVRLVSVNWFGFDEGEFVVGGLDKASLQTIVHEIRTMGFNSVRLPWANQVLESNPLVPDYALQANPELKGKRALDVMDAVITALAAENLMVILDNHVSRADWCCDDKDGNGLWYNRDYPEVQWILNWQTIAWRFAGEPHVIGVALRNELRSGADWGSADPSQDWHAAAERGGDAVLSINPRLLIFVEGPSYSTQFEKVGSLPVRLKVPHRLVYSPHDYSWSQPVPMSYEELRDNLDERWGYLAQGKAPTPIWIGEVGTCQDTQACAGAGFWFPWLVRYIQERGFAWAYWPLNGTQSSGAGRTFGRPETYGLLSPDYRLIAAPSILEALGRVGLVPPS
jgi:endoglucanase